MEDTDNAEAMEKIWKILEPLGFERDDLYKWRFVCFRGSEPIAFDFSAHDPSPKKLFETISTRMVERGKWLKEQEIKSALNILS